MDLTNMTMDGIKAQDDLAVIAARMARAVEVLVSARRELSEMAGLDEVGDVCGLLCDHLDRVLPLLTRAVSAGVAGVAPPHAKRD